MDYPKRDINAAWKKAGKGTSRSSDATQDLSFGNVTLTFARFEGPFDLLVQLIEDEKLSINDISLAHVTESYLQYLDTVEKIAPEDLADFLVVATRLLLIKSRSLLPFLETDEEEEDLSGQLKMYKLFAEAAKGVEECLLAPVRIFERLPPPLIEMIPVFSPPKGLGLNDLRETLQSILDRLEPIITLPEKRLEKAVSLQEKIQHIRDLLKSSGASSFRALLQKASTRTEVVVTFLALLELVKQKNIVVSQDALFYDIEIKEL